MGDLERIAWRHGHKDRQVTKTHLAVPGEDSTLCGYVLPDGAWLAEGEGGDCRTCQVLAGAEGRGQDSNLRPRAYEARELAGLLHPAETPAPEVPSRAHHPGRQRAAA